MPSTIYMNVPVQPRNPIQKNRYGHAQFDYTPLHEDLARPSAKLYSAKSEPNSRHPAVPNRRPRIGPMDTPNKKGRTRMDAAFFNLVELSGIEPLTSTLPVLRSPS